VDNAALAYAAVIFRIGGCIAVAPLLPSGPVAWRWKAAGLAVLSVGVATAAPVRESVATSPLASLSFDSALLVPLSIAEAGVGAILGWLVLLVFAAVRAAAQLVSQQIGLGAAAVVDPVGGSEEDALARLHGMLALLVFFTLDLHLLLLRTVIRSFVLLPPGSMEPSALPGFLAGLVVSTGGGLFVAAVSLALPVLAAMWIVSACQGMLGRALPEAELLVLGLPVRILIGLGVIALSLPAASASIGRLFEAAVEDGSGWLAMWTER